MLSVNFESVVLANRIEGGGLKGLEKEAPKTTVALLDSIHSCNLPREEAEKMAVYLLEIIQFFQFENIAAFDRNTSHIIGREWREIDYTGEGMTWQSQQKKYQPYGVFNFKSSKCLQAFFPIESKLPYFIKIYKPKKKF